MTRFKWWVAIAAISLFAFAWPTHAQTSAQGQKVLQMTGGRGGGINYADSVFYLQSMSPTGGASVAEQYPVTTYSMIAPAFLSSQFLHCSGVLNEVRLTLADGSTAVVKDSSSVEDTQGYNRLGLLVYPTFDDSTGAVLLAYSVRVHQSGSHDSLSTYSVPKLRTLTAPSDTIGSFLDRTESAAVNDSSGAFPQERYLVLSHMNGPRGIFIPLTDRDGANLGGAKISVTWRHIRSYYAVSLGGMLRGHEVRCRVRADLVGRRD